MTSKRLSKLSPTERAEYEHKRFELMYRDYRVPARCRPYIEAQTRLVMPGLVVARENFVTKDEFVRVVRPMLDQYAREIIRAVAWGKGSTGGARTAEDRKRRAAERDQKIRDEAAKIESVEGPDIKRAALAAMLAERSLGKKEALRKKLRRRKS